VPGGKLRVSPPGRLSDAERVELVGHKPELLRLLAGEEAWPSDPPDHMPVAVLVVRPDGSQVYVPLADYQAGPDTLNPPKERKPCPPKKRPSRRRRTAT
jgi:hypothetical protein